MNVVTANFVAAGTVDTFDRTAFREALLSAFPAATDAVITSVTSASVKVTTELVFPNAQDASTTADSIAHSTPAALSTKLDTTIDSVESVEFRNQLVLTPPPPAPPPADGKDTQGGSSRFSFTPGFIVGAIVVPILLIWCLVCVAVWCCLRRRRQRDAVPPPPQVTPSGQQLADIKIQKEENVKYFKTQQRIDHI